jgi:hypothetical protein
MKKTVFLTALVAMSLTLTSCDSTGQPGSSTGSSTAGDSVAGGPTSQSGGTTESAIEEPKGPTEAPDLTSVGSFREGPTTPQGNSTTLVDFEFDQRAYLKGGDRTSFHLARKNGSDALDATSMAPQDDKEDDTLVTAVFPGKLKPGDFARGYVDSQTATSRKQGANKENPSNINQSSKIGDGKTKNPDLISVTRDRDQLLYEFDQPLTEDDVVQNTGGLRIYFPKTDNSSLRQAGALSVDRKDASTLKAFFGRDLPGGRKLEEAAGAFVKQGTVQAAKGSRGGNDGKSAFDELSTID